MRTYRDVGEQLEQHDGGLHQPRGGGGAGHHRPSLHGGEPQEDDQTEAPQLRAGREHRQPVLCKYLRGAAEASRGRREMFRNIFTLLGDILLIMSVLLVFRGAARPGANKAVATTAAGTVWG